MDGIRNPATPNLSFGSGADFFAALLPTLVTIVFVVGVIIFFFMLISGAIEWMSSGGDKANIENAKKRVTNALVGIFLLLSTFAIVKLVEGIFSISILRIDFANLFIS